jgi:lipopolysaccharide/colanic/teichoic acid biosynthesis glycosyltransferase
MSLKRLCDIILSACALLVLSPLMVPIMVILRFTGEHYVFYGQPRVGRNGKLFMLLKFATMLKDSPNMGTGDITVLNDPRVLPVGRILRKTKINELPQLINVLKGDMSLIGPRPVTPKHFAYYGGTVKATIGRVRPGLSGVGSVVFRDEETMIAQSGLMPEELYQGGIAPCKGALEVWYVEHQSLALDLLLIGLTLWVVLSPGSTCYRWLLKGLPEPSLSVLSEDLKEARFPSSLAGRTGKRARQPVYKPAITQKSASPMTKTPQAGEIIVGQSH